MNPPGKTMQVWELPTFREKRIDVDKVIMQNRGGSRDIDYHGASAVTLGSKKRAPKSSRGQRPFISKGAPPQSTGLPTRLFHHSWTAASEEKHLKGGRTRALSFSCGTSQQPDRGDGWTARERACRVHDDQDLQWLLKKELRKSGYVTAAGSRVVLGDFLYSDAVEREMGRQRGGSIDDSEQSVGARFASVLSGMTATTANATASLAASNLSSGSVPFFRRYRRISSGASSHDDGPAAANLAPRRMSKEQVSEGPQVVAQEGRQTFRQEAKLQKLRPIKFGTMDFDPECTMSQDPSTKHCMGEGGVPKEVSLVIEGILNSPQRHEDTAATTRHSPDVDVRSQGAINDGGSDCSSLCYASSCDCGWLPWPKQGRRECSAVVRGRAKDEGARDSDSDEDDDDDDDDTAFLPWPER